MVRTCTWFTHSLLLSAFVALPQASFRRFKSLCEAHYREEEAVSRGGSASGAAPTLQPACPPACPPGPRRACCTLYGPPVLQETLPLIRQHFAPEEVTPTAKMIAKAYNLRDMGEGRG